MSGLRRLLSVFLASVAGTGVAACLLELVPAWVQAAGDWHDAVVTGVLALGALDGALVGLLLSGARRRAEPIALRLGGMVWTRNDFCRGWYISGATGSGKTEALKLLMHLLCRSERDWGGLLIDEKGFFAEEVLPLVAAYGRGADIRELRIRPEDTTQPWSPPFRFNILGDERVRTSQYVDAILSVAEAVTGGRDDKGFFKTQAGLHIGAAIDLFRGLRCWQREVGQPPSRWVAPTLRGVYEILTSEEDFRALLGERTGLFVEEVVPGPKPEDEPTRMLVPDFRGHEPAPLLQAVDHFRKRYWNVRAQEQMEGVKGTITNYLRWFTDDAIHEVFGAEDANFTMTCMDEGRLICLSLPQRYAIERRCLCALLKVLAYAHARSREPTHRDYNLMVIWQDEAQRFILPVDGDVDILRQYQVTTVVATQFRAQLERALGGREQAAPIIGNLRNRIILQAADEECAEESARFIGKGLRKRRSLTRQPDGRRSHSYTDEVSYVIEPYQLRSLPKFVAVFCHAGGRHRVLQFTPLDNHGRVPPWFERLALPGLRFRLLASRRGPKYCAFVPPQVRVPR